MSQMQFHTQKPNSQLYPLTKHTYYVKLISVLILNAHISSSAYQKG